MLRVVIVGGAIGVTGALVLLIAFRAFGKTSRGSLLVAILLAFVFFCCVILLRVSLLK